MKVNQDVVIQAQIIRRQITAMCAAAAACLFCFLTIADLQAGLVFHSVVTGFAAVSAGVIGLLSIRVGVSGLVLRLGIAAMLAVLFIEATQARFIYLLLIPVLMPMLYILFWGFREAAIWSVATAVAGIFFLYLHEVTSTIEVSPGVLAMFFVLSFVVALGYQRMWSSILRSTGGEQHRLETEIAEKNAIAARNDQLFSDLNSALREVRELTGLIPMCASCKKIRGDEDFWEHVEAYLHKRTQLQFSHGLCPECSSEAMDDIDQHSHETGQS